jgi:hypothetical protein
LHTAGIKLDNAGCIPGHILQQLHRACLSIAVYQKRRSS